jgi:hypothetical protein
MTWSGYTIYKN